jgi:hypothetical protein
MGAREDLAALLRDTETVQSLVRGLEAESTKMLASICAEFESTDKGVPDHHLHVVGYLGDAALRALLSAQLIDREPGDRLSICRYRPTEKGLSCYRALVAENVL